MDKTRFATFTGKASLVLQNKGLPATTIHKLIYDAFKNRRTGKFYFRKKEILDPRIKLIVIDEVSMVPANLLRDLMSFEIPIVALGDPGQLEPIGEDNGLLKKPDFFLDEIHRQARESDIIRLSMMAREGYALPFIDNNPDVKVISRNDISAPMLQWADQILCGTNAMRHAINRDMRKSVGYTSIYPEVGEKVICLHNYWDELNSNKEPLINGSIGRVTSIVRPELEDRESILMDDVTIGFKADYSSSEWEHIKIDSNIFKGFAPYASENPTHKQQYHEFDFGYAITVHKAQGSGFNNVIVFEERMRGSDHARWLYTAITRAIDKLIIVKS